MRKEYDFSKAKRAYQVPHLAKLQAEHQNQSKITMQVDNDILAIFKNYAQINGANHQVLMNESVMPISARFANSPKKYRRKNVVT